MNIKRHFWAALVIASSVMANDNIVEGSMLTLHINMDGADVFETPISYHENYIQFKQEAKLSNDALRSCSATISGEIILEEEESLAMLKFASFQDTEPDFRYEMLVNNKRVMGKKVLVIPQRKKNKKIVTWSMILDVKNPASCVEQVKSILHPALKKVAMHIANGKKPSGKDYTWRKVRFIPNEKT